MGGLHSLKTGHGFMEIFRNNLHLSVQGHTVELLSYITHHFEFHMPLIENSTIFRWHEMWC